MKYYLGREPVFTAALDIFGYELLYRSAPGAVQSAGKQAVAKTSSVLSAVLSDGGMKDLVGERFAFVNFSADLLDGSMPLPASVGVNRIVVEVLESVEDTPEIRAGLKGLRDRGYLVALDDFVPNGPQAELLPLADIVKLDVQALGRVVLAEAVPQLNAERKRVLAEKVQSQEEFDFCAELGADYVQGYFLERPVLSRSPRSLPAGWASCSYSPSCADQT
ncbi:MAG: EAL and HDOD domain-containing protein [Planctomycetota bacterium]|jgi:EAL and modified HD-GYP domain-containing signal transduction protein